MELGNDLLFKIALELELEDIINYCALSKKHNQAVCENKHFWRERLRDEPDYMFNIIVGLSHGGTGRGTGTFVISLSRYIPNRDVIRLIQVIVGRFLEDMRINNDHVELYEVTTHGVNPGALSCPVLNDACFSNFNRNTQELIVGVFLKFNDDIDDDIDTYHMTLRKRLNILYADELKKYTESLRGTNKEYLIGLARLEPPPRSIKKRKQ